MAEISREVIRGHYTTVQEPFGLSHEWHPPRVVLQCSCGNMAVCTERFTKCKCGADYSETVQHELSLYGIRNQDDHPWRVYRNLGEGLPY